MSVKKFLMGRAGSYQVRPESRTVHRVALDSDRSLPFLRGMARVIDVGGALRETNAEAARREYRELIKALRRRNVDVMIIGSDLDAMGQDFRRVIGPAADRDA